jgi:hypothetical protein
MPRPTPEEIRTAREELATHDHSLANRYRGCVTCCRMHDERDLSWDEVIGRYTRLTRVAKGQNADGTIF